jgi:hypothetical protein
MTDSTRPGKSRGAGAQSSAHRPKAVKTAISLSAEIMAIARQRMETEGFSTFSAYLASVIAKDAESCPRRERESDEYRATVDEHFWDNPITNAEVERAEVVLFG